MNDSNLDKLCKGMREATYQERIGVYNYLKTHAKSTGISLYSDDVFDLANEVCLEGNGNEV